MDRIAEMQTLLRNKDEEFDKLLSNTKGNDGGNVTVLREQLHAQSDLIETL